MPRPTRLRHPRGYDERWLKERRAYLAHNPECLGCAAIGLRVAADTVDHIIPHGGDQSLFWNQGNWQPACSWHHSSIKASLENLWQARKVPTESLHLDSDTAIRITRANHFRRDPPPIGANGWPMPRRRGEK